MLIPSRPWTQDSLCGGASSPLQNSAPTEGKKDKLTLRWIQREKLDQRRSCERESRVDFFWRHNKRSTFCSHLDKQAVKSVVCLSSLDEGTGLKYFSVSSALAPKERGQMAVRLGHFLHGGGSSQSWLTVSPLRLQRKLLIPNAQKDANGSGFTGSGIFVHNKTFNLHGKVTQKVHYCIKVCLHNHKLFTVFICRHQPSPAPLTPPPPPPPFQCR